MPTSAICPSYRLVSVWECSAGEAEEQSASCRPTAAAGTRASPSSVPCLSAGVGYKVREIVGAERRIAGVEAKTGNEGRRFGGDMASSWRLPGTTRQLVRLFGYAEGTHQGRRIPRPHARSRYHAPDAAPLPQPLFRALASAASRASGSSERN